MAFRAEAVTAILLTAACSAVVAGQVAQKPTVTISAERTAVPENPNQVTRSTGTTSLSTSPTSGPTFTVRIDVALPVDVSLPYSVSGSAVNGKDYQSLSGSVIVRAGQTTGTITVTPIDDSEDETDETVVVAIVSNSSSPYTVGRPGSASTTILDDDDVRIVDASFAPDTVLGGRSHDLRITLSGAAPAGGLAVRVQSGNGSIVSDGQATVAAGTRVGVATLTTTMVAATVTVPVAAVEPNGSSANAALTVLTEPSVSRMNFRRSDTYGGGTVSGSVALDAPAPPGGLDLPVSLAVQSPAGASLPATAPAILTFSGGSSAAVLAISTQPVATLTQIDVTVGSGANSGTTTVGVYPVPVVESVSASPVSVSSEDSVDITVRTADPVPALFGGWNVFVSGTGPVQIPGDNHVAIPAGTSEGTIRLGTTSVAADTEATVGVSESQGGAVTNQTRFTVTPPSVETVRFRGSVILGGESTSGEVRLTALAPPGGLTVPITLSSPGVSAAKIPASAPASATIAPGSRYGTFTVETQPVTASIEVQVAAGTGPNPATATLELHPVPQVENFVVAPDPADSGDSVTVRVHLDQQYLGGNTYVLELAGTGPVDVPPFTVALFPRYDQDARVRLGVASVADTTLAELFLQSAGSTVANGVARFRVAPPSVNAVRFRGALMAGGQSTTGEVVISADAPASGLILPVTLSSPTGGRVPATAPATVTVAPGADRGFFTVETQPVVSATPVPVIVTVGQGAGARADTIEIAQVPDVESVIVGPDPVEGGDTIAVRVQLNVRNWLGTTFALWVTGNGPVDVPPNSVILVQHGSDAGRIRLGTSDVTTATTASINLSPDPSRPSPSNHSFSVVPAPVALPPLAITELTAVPTNPIGGGEIELTVTLSRPADAGGYAAALSSTDPTVIPPPTMQVAAGQQTGTVRVRTAAVPAGQSVHLGVPGSPTADIVLRPLPLDRIQGPGSVRGGDVVNMEVRLLEPAPAGGLRVTLASSDAVLAVVPAFVDVPAGATAATVQVHTRAGPSDAQVVVTAGVGPAAVSREFRVRS